MHAAEIMIEILYSPTFSNDVFMPQLLYYMLLYFKNTKENESYSWFCIYKNRKGTKPHPYSCVRVIHRSPVCLRKKSVGYSSILYQDKAMTKKHNKHTADERKVLHIGDF